LDIPSTPPPPPLSFFLKGGLGLLGALSFAGHNFQFNFEKICLYEFLEKEKNDQP
jgi:hypothetical protein